MNSTLVSLARTALPLLGVGAVLTLAGLRLAGGKEDPVMSQSAARAAPPAIDAAAPSVTAVATFGMG